jgi:hypothetical protein
MSLISTKKDKMLTHLSRINAQFSYKAIDTPDRFMHILCTTGKRQA